MPHSTEPADRERACDIRSARRGTLTREHRPSIIFIHEDPSIRDDLAAAVGIDGRLHWAGGFAGLDAIRDRGRRQPADVVVIDAGRGGTIDSVSGLARLWPRMVVLVLVEEADLSSLVLAVDAGAVGFLPRVLGVRMLLDAACLAHGGCAVISHRILRLVSEHVRSAQLADSGWPNLRRAEIQILAHLSTGASQKETAESLGLAYQTVRNSCQRIYRQLGVNTRRAAVRKYLAGNRHEE
ncbi:MAG: response regulator transcription factor [Verrucomicrobiales bacterium]|nr:response regulator transcription factor [Verrucomicrobiales bacterium]